MKDLNPNYRNVFNHLERYALALVVLAPLCFTSCSDVNETDSQSTSKLYSDENSYWDDYEDNQYGSPYDDDNSWAQSENDLSANDQALIDEFLAQELGAVEYGDLTDGEVLVAGPGYGVDVVLACSEGALYVTAGVATGALATVFAASGVVAAGGGVAVTAPASVPLFAAAGGLIGLASSSGSWTQCFGGLAQIGLGLIRQGYFSVARGFQQVLRRSSPSASNSGTAAGTSTCTAGSQACRQMNQRYHNYCDSLEEATQAVTGRWNGGLCTQANRFFQRYDCNKLYDLVRDAANCEAGRRLVTDRCYGGQWDQGHLAPWNNAKNQYRRCSSLYQERCGSLEDYQTIKSQAEDLYPECR
mgnify:CR=1 FL=1